MRRFASVLLAFLAAAPAASQVRVIVDGRTQDVPAGVIRTVSYEPGGRQIVHDEPFRGAVMPGAATVTTTETTDEDEAGNAIRTSVVTRIEPMAAVAYAPPPGYTMQPAMQGNVIAQPAIYAAPPQGPLVEAEAPHLDTDADVLDAPSPGDSHPQVLHIRRDAMTGHFIAMIRINGVAVRAIVDTGAQSTVLSARDAKATGADRDVTATQAMAGIGGYSLLKVTRVRSIDVGGQQLGGCAASIGEEGIPYTLLGQTEIARLGRIVIEDGEMTITPRVLEVAAR